MQSVLRKTVASLETALRYNPDNTELMASLVESYIRMGRLDNTTIELCEKVLSQQPGNELVQQAQAAAFVIDQVEQIDANLGEGKTPPDPGAIRSSIEILEDLMELTEGSAAIWFALTRLCLIGSMLERAAEGVARMKELGFEDWPGLRRTLDWIARNRASDHLDWIALHGIYTTIGEPAMGVRVLEDAFDRGVDHDRIAPILLQHYLGKYSSSDPGAVPESVRPRLFQAMLDHGDPAVTADWLRKASMFGWEISSYSKSYVKELIEDGQHETAFEILQRMTMDAEVRDMLNQVAEAYEERDAVDQAVGVLRFINEHVLAETEVEQARETELACEMELSLAELHLKNDRVEEALPKFVSALCLSDKPDADIAERIDALLSRGVNFEPSLLLRLSAYYRQNRDHPKTVYYLNRILERHPADAEALHEMENLFSEILQANPDNPELRLELGKLYSQMDRFDEAIEAFQKAAEAPQHAESSRRAMALAYQKAGKLSESLSRFQSLPITDADLEPLYQLHLQFQEKRDDRSARITLEMILKRQIDFRDAAARVREIDARIESASASSAGDAKMTELIGDLAVGRYEYCDRVGSGGMGVVHKVRDQRLGKFVAMKILRDGLSGSSKALDRFFREARIAASIHHRNIVEIYDYNISSVNGQSYICMEFVDGPSLRQVVDTHFENTISIGLDYITETLHYTVQLLDALESTHEKRITHRDIKPDNIMITTNGEVKITDFGIVHVEDATFTPTGAMLGTPRYMSPEQVTGARVDGRSDIYSVGILLYEVLTGSPPFITGDISYQQVNKRPVEPRVINTVIPQSVNDFIMRCLEKNPDDRYDNAREAKVDLAETLDSLGGCRKYNALTAAHGDTGNSEYDNPDPTLTRDPPSSHDLDADLDLDGHAAPGSPSTPAGRTSSHPTRMDLSEHDSKSITPSGDLDLDLDLD